MLRGYEQIRNTVINTFYKSLESRIIRGKLYFPVQAFRVAIQTNSKAKKPLSHHTLKANIIKILWTINHYF